MFNMDIIVFDPTSLKGCYTYIALKVCTADPQHVMILTSYSHAEVRNASCLRVATASASDSRSARHALTSTALAISCKAVAQPWCAGGNALSRAR